MIDPVDQLEHDHLHLTKMVDSLRESIQACIRDEMSIDELRTEFTETVAVLQDELLEHFDHEEQAVFPWIVERLPDTAELIEGLERGHDRMCGLVTRMAWALGHDDTFGSGFDGLIALFSRFDANYARHAVDEVALLRSLDTRLRPDERAEISKLLDAI